MEEILELYQKIASIYEEVYGVEQRRKYWLISSQMGERVVDAGCGVGISLDILTSYVVCLDISPDMLRLAKRRRGELGELIIADYWKPPFRGNSFDSLLLISSVEPGRVEQLLEKWRGIAKKAIFEFRGIWRVFTP